MLLILWIMGIPISYLQNRKLHKQAFKEYSRSERGGTIFVSIVLSWFSWLISWHILSPNAKKKAKW